MPGLTVAASHPAREAQPKNTHHAEVELPAAVLSILFFYREYNSTMSASLISAPY